MAKLNLQGLARRREEVVSVIEAPKGMTLVSSDAVSGEPTVTTHFSKDPNYTHACFTGVGKEPFYRDGLLMVDDIYLMTMSRSPFGGDILKDAYHSKFKGQSFAQQWVEDSEVIKKELKSQRQVHKMLCVSECTLISIKGKGLIPIAQVDKGDEIWDGENWVLSDGPVFKGYQNYIELSKDRMTYDHRVLTKSGWQKAAEPGREISEKDLERLRGPSYRWRDVWAMACRIFKSPHTWQIPLYLSYRWYYRGLEKLRQPTVRQVHKKP